MIRTIGSWVYSKSDTDGNMMVADRKIWKESSDDLETACGDNETTTPVSYNISSQMVLEYQVNVTEIKNELKITRLESVLIYMTEDAKIEEDNIV